MKKNRISVSWSGGKDSSLMLQHILKDPSFEIAELHTVVNSESRRVGLHGVHEDLIRAQAEAIGIPIRFIDLNPDNSNNSYEDSMGNYYQLLSDEKISHIAFGDIFLEELRDYREQLLSPHDLTGVYPLWSNDTTELSTRFIETGFESIICSSNSELFNQSICGKYYNKALINNFPVSVDPCGENGEFHSFVVNGPFFKYPLEVYVNQIVEKEYSYQSKEGKAISKKFEFADLRMNF